MTRLRAFWEYLRGTYRAVPSAMAVAAVGLSVGMVQFDEAVTARLLDRLSWVYTGGPEGARAVLSTIAASMITVAGVTFSITIVALTLASQQFGPRLLRTFLRGLGNQVVLGTFVATFIYCLLVLGTVRGSDDEEFVQHEADRRALLRQAAAIAGALRESPFSESDRELIARCYRATLTALREPPDDRLVPSSPPLSG